MITITSNANGTFNVQINVDIPLEQVQDYLNFFQANRPKPSHRDILKGLIQSIGTSNKLELVKQLKEATGLSLKESKDLVDELVPYRP